MDITTKRWLFFMELCKNSCHQKPERSFYYKQFQFPICARCLGINIGYILGISSLLFIKITFITALLLCIPIIIDVFMQYHLKIMSTNLRRLITGILGGFGQVIIFIYGIMVCYNYFIH